jgi:hypothetical protein
MRERDRLREAIELGVAMAESEARRMLALKVRAAVGRRTSARGCTLEIRRTAGRQCQLRLAAAHYLAPRAARHRWRSASQRLTVFRGRPLVARSGPAIRRCHLRHGHASRNASSASIENRTCILSGCVSMYRTTINVICWTEKISGNCIEHLSRQK